MRAAVSIRTFLTVMNLGLLLLVFSSVSFFVLTNDNEFRNAILHRTIKQMRKNLESRSATLVRSMSLSATQSIDAHEFVVLNRLLAEVVADDPQIIYALVMDQHRKAVSHSNKMLIGKHLEEDIDYYAQEILDRIINETHRTQHRGQVYFIDEFTPSPQKSEPLMESITPIVVGAEIFGLMRCAYSLNDFHAEIAHVEQEWMEKHRQFIKKFISMAVIFFLLALLMAWCFTRYLLGEFGQMAAGVTRVAEEDFSKKIDERKLFIKEFRKLAESFNLMVNTLAENRKRLAENGKLLAIEVDERTQELQKANQNLIQQAHESGMAEMAVGILHNIGNAITPAKVSTQLLLKDLSDSPATKHLEQAMDLMRHAIAASNDIAPENKERLLNLTKLLPQVNSTERETIMQELSSITKKHEHIISIISLQMRYAQLFGTPAEVDLNDIIEDALSMLGSSINKHPVEIIKNLGKIPKVRMDQSKMIQVIINLIKNAYESMAGKDAGERTLTITTSFEEWPDPVVTLSIKDTGLGFSEAERDKLFGFGFSTKEKGSGFGLHSCANFLIAHHGSIEAFSPGPGKGAEFVVKLRPV